MFIPTGASVAHSSGIYLFIYLSNTRRSPPNSYTEASFIVCTRLDSGVCIGTLRCRKRQCHIRCQEHSLSAAGVLGGCRFVPHLTALGQERVSLRPVIYVTSWSKSLQASRCRFLPPCAALGKDRRLSLREGVPFLTFLTAGAYGQVDDVSYRPVQHLARTGCSVYESESHL